MDWTEQTQTELPAWETPEEITVRYPDRKEACSDVVITQCILCLLLCLAIVLLNLLQSTMAEAFVVRCGALSETDSAWLDAVSRFLTTLLSGA